MKKLVIYTNPNCSFCGPVKRALDEAGIPYLDQDITSSMGILRAFLKLRDTRPEFDDIKASGRVGLPCILTEDKEIYFSLPENLDDWK